MKSPFGMLPYILSPRLASSTVPKQGKHTLVVTQPFFHPPVMLVLVTFLYSADEESAFLFQMMDSKLSSGLNHTFTLEQFLYFNTSLPVSCYSLFYHPVKNSVLSQPLTVIC